jgi:glucokinase
VTDASTAGSRPAPPAAPLGPGEPVLAFDVGGTDIKAALVDAAGRLAELVRVPTPHAGRDTGEAVVAAVAGLAERFAGGHPEIAVRAAGLLVPGHVDDEAGVGVFAENLGWRDFPFRARAEETLRLPVSFSHDVRGAGEAEHRLGAAAPYRDVVVMAIGTGIAGAIFVDGRLYTGGGLAGEMGHSRVADGPLCPCGGVGCLEAVASAAAIGRRYAELSSADTTALDVAGRAAAGEPSAARVWQDALAALADGLLTAQALFDAGTIVLGGGLAEAGDTLLTPLRAALDQRVTYHRMPRLIRAALGDMAGCLGAALLALDPIAARMTGRTERSEGHVGAGRLHVSGFDDEVSSRVSVEDIPPAATP